MMRSVRTRRAEQSEALQADMNAKAMTTDPPDYGIRFVDNPSTDPAAHEAVHVVQQLPGGHGETSQEADAVSPARQRRKRAFPQPVMGDADISQAPAPTSPPGQPRKPVFFPQPSGE